MKRVYAFIVFLLVLLLVVPVAGAEDSGLPIDEAHFPDPVLREWLQNLAWFDGWKQVPITDYEGNVINYQWEWSEAYKDGVLNDYELNHKDFIDPGNSNLADLSGIEYLTNLKRVYLANVMVANADISGFSKLTEFHLSGPRLERLDASGCSSLTVIGFGGSSILEEANLSGCSSLNTIYCTGTQSLLSINLSGCNSLVYFCGGQNNFSSLNFSGFSALQSVCGDGDELSSVNVNGCTNLKELWIGSREKMLQKLDLSSCGALRRLGCQASGLEELDLSNNTMLEELHCENNSLTELDLSNNSALTGVICSPQFMEGVKPRKTSKGYEVDLSEYVSKLENIVLIQSGLRRVQNQSLLTYQAA